MRMNHWFHGMWCILLAKEYYATLDKQTPSRQTRFAEDTCNGSSELQELYRAQTQPKRPEPSHFRPSPPEPITRYVKTHWRRWTTFLLGQMPKLLVHQNNGPFQGLRRGDRRDRGKGVRGWMRWGCRNGESYRRGWARKCVRWEFYSHNISLILTWSWRPW